MYMYFIINYTLAVIIRFSSSRGSRNSFITEYLILSTEDMFSSISLSSLTGILDCALKNFLILFCK